LTQFFDNLVVATFCGHLVSVVWCSKLSKLSFCKVLQLQRYYKFYQHLAKLFPKHRGYFLWRTVYKQGITYFLYTNQCTTASSGYTVDNSLSTVS